MGKFNHPKRGFPRVNSIREVINRSQFTDGGSTSGTYQMTDELPAGSMVLFSRVKVPVAFIGDTSAALIIGDGSDTDRYNTGTPSVFTAAATGLAVGVPSGTAVHTSAAVRPTLTVTSNADFTNVSAGQLDVEIVFVEPGID